MNIKFNGYVYDDEFIKKLDKECERVQAHGFKDYLHNATYGGVSIIKRIREIREESESFKKIDKEKELKLSQDKLLQIVKDFYKTLSPTLFQKVDSILDKNNPNPDYKVEIIEDKSDPRFGKSRVGHSNRNTYLDVNIGLDNSVEGLRITAHELAHAMSAHHTKKVELSKQKDENQFKDLISCLGSYGVDSIGEIESHIIEYLFMEYLVDRGIISSDDFKNFEAKRHNSLLNNLDLIREEYYILSHLSCPITADSFEHFVKKINTPFVKTDRYKSLMNRSKFMAERKKEDNTLDHYSQYRFRYVIGEIISSLWFEQYTQANEQQKKKMIETFENFLSKTDSANLETACHELVGLGIGQTFEEYICYLQGKMFER